MGLLRGYDGAFRGYSSGFDGGLGGCGGRSLSGADDGVLAADLGGLEGLGGFGGCGGGVCGGVLGWGGVVMRAVTVCASYCASGGRK